MSKRVWLAVLLVLPLLQAPAALAADVAKDTPVLHVVLFRFKDLKPEEVPGFLNDAKTILAKVPGVLEVRAGHKAAEERDVHVKDYSIALYIRFASKDALTAYGPHPTHLQFADKWRPRFENVRVMDFYSE